jgi:uncharacterized protein (DUF2062 family)
MHCQLRTEADTPARTAGSILLGTFIGCLPVWGAHLVLCFGLARLLGLSRAKTYLAAHVNNPVTVPFLLGLEFGVGHVLFTGTWPAFDAALLRGMTLAGVGRDLLVGSVVVGAILGLVLGTFSLLISWRWRLAPLWEKLREETARRYVDAGVAHWEFVRAKLRHDPVYREIIAAGFLPGDGRLLDLGCGRGILLALFQASVDLHSRGEWDPEWCPPPHNLALEGVECRASHASVARTATQGGARIIVADLVGLTLSPAKAVTLLDVLHYLSADEQASLLRRAGEALEPGGVILIREPDTARSVRFLVTRVGERMSSMLRGEWRRPLHYRSTGAWCALLEQQGLVVETRPSWRGTPFANVLIRCRKPEARSPELVP